jgi:hypothetical protein
MSMLLLLLLLLLQDNERTFEAAVAAAACGRKTMKEHREKQKQRIQQLKCLMGAVSCPALSKKCRVCRL